MVISDSYGSIQTPSENNSDFSAVATALGAPFAFPANMPAGAQAAAVMTFEAQNGSLPGSVGGTFATAALMTKGFVQ